METNRRSAHTVREELRGILVFLGVLWAVWLVGWLLGRVTSVELLQYGLRSRTLVGLVGVATMPFLHAGLSHLLGNTLALVVLLALLAGSRARSWEIVIEIVILGGLLLWVFGRGQVVHVGASGLVFGLASFLIVAGGLERRPLALVVAIVVALFYGSTLLTGVLPTAGPNVSWDGHLTGAVAGALVAYFRVGPSGEAQPPAEKTPE
jgi:membrane associated rhomboid family serine protease